MSNIFCTICTPTYNRAYILDSLYNSLLRQTDKDFEWVVVDDGSQDNTSELIKKFVQEDKIKIKYIYKENGGKHRALNVGIDSALGKYFMIVDSDDYIVDNAVEILKEKSKVIDEDMSFGGVAFNKGYSVEKIVGTTFKGSFIDATTIERPKYNINGDKCEIFKTKVLKENKFPEIDGENFMSEIVLWTRIAYKGYKLRWYNETIYICDYLEDGLTKNNDSLLKKNYKGNALRIREQVSLANIDLKKKMGYYSKYYSLRKDEATLSKIAKELDSSKFLIITSYLIRKLLRR